MAVQGRRLHCTNIDWVRQLLQKKPSLNLTRIFKAVSRQWACKRPRGQAWRPMLRKLQKLGFLVLPTPRDARHYQRQTRAVPHRTKPVRNPLSTIRPIRIVETHSTYGQDNLFCHLLSHYRYLGIQATCVGEDIRNLVCDMHSRPLACLLFGSVAWKIESSYAYIGRYGRPSSGECF